jgi:AcrR family transcriptional regulator
VAGVAAENDGRLARSRKTRAAILDALLDLLREGAVQPSATEIAARAGISKRSIFVHYATLEELHQDLAERATATVLDLLWVIDPTLPLDQRIAAITEQRAKVHEAIGPLRRAAALRASTSPTAAESQAFARRSSQEQVERVFAPELGRLGDRERRAVAAAVDATLAGESWDLWRTVHGFEVPEATSAMRTALARLLGAPVGDAGVVRPR